MAAIEGGGESGDAGVWGSGAGRGPCGRLFSATGKAKADRAAGMPLGTGARGREVGEHTG